MSSPVHCHAGALNTVEVYDPETNKWSAGQRTIIARSSHAVAGKPNQLDGEPLRALVSLGWRPRNMQTYFLTYFTRVL